jgi:hypothetical protein
VAKLRDKLEVSVGIGKNHLKPEAVKQVTVAADHRDETVAKGPGVRLEGLFHRFNAEICMTAVKILEKSYL